MGLFQTVPFLQEALLFLLAFVVVFAILQKSKILGDGVAKINSLVALAFALIFVGFSSATDVVSKMIPWVAVALSVILMFLLLWGFVGGEIGNLPGGIKWTLIALSAVFMIVLLLYVTGWWTGFRQMFDFDNSFLYTILAFVGVIGAVVYVVVSSKKD
jgi:hypothetical protein